MYSNLNDFSLEFMKTLRDSEGKKGDLFLSPLCVSIDVAMLISGASYETRDQIAGALNFSDRSDEEINGFYRGLLRRLPSGDLSTLDIASSMFIRKGVPVYDNFKQSLHENYCAELFGMDMARADATRAINEWCSEKTHGRISDIVGNVGNSTALLLNAVYFKAKWQTKFNKQTVDWDFKSSTGSIEKVKMMSVTLPFGKYTADGRAQVLELPYEDGLYVMDVILPLIDFNEYLASFDSSEWDKYASSFDFYPVRVKMPEMSIEYSGSIKANLENMGMVDAFRPSANFSGISNRKLYVNDACHKTWLKVDYKGTEAAAAAKLEIWDTSSGPSSKKPQFIDFIADHSYIFLIREKTTGAIIFTGIKD